MKKTEKEFDSVHLMRALRDSLSSQMQGMSFNQQRKYIQERLRSRPAKHTRTK